MNQALPIVRAIWAIGYAAAACGPLLTGNPFAAGLGLLAGAILLIPWLVGTLVLAVLVWLTNPSER